VLSLLLVLTVPVVLLPAAAQGSAKWRIGFIEAGSLRGNQHFLNAFRMGMSELGYVEGIDIAIEDRWADGRAELFPGLLAELLGRKVDLLVVASSAGALAAKNARTTVPVVFNVGSDPVELGLVASLARPGGNMTGLSLAWDREFYGKWVDLLKEIAPNLTRLAALRESLTPVSWAQHVRDAADAKGVTIDLFEVSDRDQLDSAFAAMNRNKVAGLIVLPGPFTVRHRLPILDLAAKTRLPAIYGFGEFPRTGGLMSYGTNMPEVFRRTATYVDKILKGSRPAELPVERPTTFELVINLKTARTLGLTIPSSLLLRADELIE
jgi:putative ABC transport system substrate-binding protein